MALKDIVQKIESEGNQKISLMVSEWDQKINQEKDKRLKNLNLSTESEKERIVKKVDETENKKILDVKLDQRNKILMKKIEKIDSIFESVHDDLKSLSEDEYVSILFDMIKKSEEFVENDKVELIFNESDKKNIAPKLIKKLGGKYILSNDVRDISGGVVIKDGLIEYNQSFDLILA